MLSVGTKVGYSMGNVAAGMILNSVTFYLLLFYTDIMGLSGAWVGAALAVGRLWDAFTDPTMGHITDRTRSRLGRRRPYILFGSPLFVAAFVLLWWSPTSRSPQTLFAYLLAMQLFLTTMQTVVMVPYGALGAELTMDYYERNSVMAYQQGALLVGMAIGACMLNFASLIGAALTPETRVAGGEALIGAFIHATSYKEAQGGGFRLAVLLLAPVAVTAFLWTVWSTSENTEFQRRSSVHPLRSILSTFKNGPFRIFVFAHLITTTALQIGNFMLPYIIIHWVRKPGYIFPGYLIYTASILCGLPLWRALGQRVEKKHCYSASLVASLAVAFLFLAMVTPKWPPSLFIWGAIAGLTGGGGLIYIPSMMADVIDTDELDSGLRREGAFMSVDSFLRKCATALGALWMGSGLALAGYDGLADAQSERTLLIMRLMYVSPAVLYILVILVMRRFPLTSKVMADVHRAINAREEESGTSTP